MSKLANAKLHYKLLFDKDTPFINRYGTSDEREQWRKGEQIIINAVNQDVLNQIVDRMGKIRGDIHNRNQHDHNYRLFYLQHGSESIQDIEAKLGPEIANVVKNLRSMK